MKGLRLRKKFLLARRDYSTEIENYRSHLTDRANAVIHEKMPAKLVELTSLIKREFDGVGVQEFATLTRLEERTTKCKGNTTTNNEKKVGDGNDKNKYVLIIFGASHRDSCSCPCYFEVVGECRPPLPLPLTRLVIVKPPRGHILK